MGFRTEENVVPELLRLGASDAVLDRTRGVLHYRRPGAETVGRLRGAPRLAVVRQHGDGTSELLLNTTTADPALYAGPTVGLGHTYAFDTLRTETPLVLLSAVFGGASAPGATCIGEVDQSIGVLYYPSVTPHSGGAGYAIPVGGWLTLTWIEPAAVEDAPK